MDKFNECVVNQQCNCDAVLKSAIQNQLGDFYKGDYSKNIPKQNTITNIIEVNDCNRLIKENSK